MSEEKLLCTKKALEKLSLKDARTLKKYIEKYKIKRIVFSIRNIKYKEKDIDRLIEILKKKSL